MSLVFTNQNQPTGFTYTKGGFPMKAPTMSQGSYLSNSLVQYKNNGLLNILSYLINIKNINLGKIIIIIIINLIIFSWSFIRFLFF